MFPHTGKFKRCLLRNSCHVQYKKRGKSRDPSWRKCMIINIRVWQTGFSSFNALWRKPYLAVASPQTEKFVALRDALDQQLNTNFGLLNERKWAISRYLKKKKKKSRENNIYPVAEEIWPVFTKREKTKQKGRMVLQYYSAKRYGTSQYTPACLFSDPPSIQLPIFTASGTYIQHHSRRTTGLQLIKWILAVACS